MKKITLIFMLLATTFFSWQSNAQLSYNNTCTNTFDDISATGTDLALSDDGEAAISIPFGFTLDGVTSTDLYVGNNGGVLFGVTSGNVGFSSPSNPGFYPFNDDIDSDYGGVYWETLGTAPNRRVVILWYDRPHYSNSPSGATFELILHETTNEITFLYQDTDFGAGNTNNDALSAYISVIGANGSYVYSSNTALNGVTCINWVVPTCLVASNIVATASGTTTADVSWTDNNGLTATDYEYVVQPMGTGTPTSAGTPTTANPQPLAGLMASTSYEVYLRANCGSGDFSDWRKADFATQCNPFNDFTEDFDSSNTGETPLCWDSLINSTSASARVTVESSDPNSGANAMELYNGGDDASDLLLITPNLAAMQNADHRIRFMAKGNGTDPAILVGTMTDPTDVSTFAPMMGIDLTTAYVSYAIAIDAPPAGANYVAIQHGHGSTFQTIRIDDFVWEPTPSCIEPSDVFINAITTTGATVAWTENNNPAATNWDLYIVPAGDPAPDAASTPTIDDSTMPTSWAGGAANTAYDVYVRTDCGADNTNVSSWTSAATFSTLCNAFAVPFNETFNSDSNTQGCWTVLDENADLDQWNMDYTSNAFEGDEVAVINTDFNGGSNDDYLISPGIVLTGNERLKYQYRVQSSGEPNDFELLLSTTGTAPADFSTTLIANTSYSNTNYVEEIVDLSAYTGTVYVAWHVPAGGLDGWRLYIDDVTFEEIPSCFEPSDVMVSAFTTTGATVSWTENNNPAATNWDLYIVPAGDPAPDAASTPTIDDSTMPTSWAGGATNTAYDVYVRTDCGADNTNVSVWTSPVTFSTACSTYMAPYTEDFEDSGAVDSCWVQETTDDLDWTALMGSTGSSGTGPSAANSGDYYLYVETSSPASNSDMAVIYSPNIDLSGLTTPRLNLAYHMFGAGMDPDGSVDVAISNDGGVTYTSIFNQVGNQGNQWNSAIVDLSSYSGVVSFKITGTVSSSGTSFENDFAIDDFMVEESPAVAPSCATNVVVVPFDSNCGNMGVVATWDAVATADGYKLTVGTTSGGNDVMDNVDLGNVLTYSSTNSDVNVTYYFTLTPYNVVGDASGCTEGSVTTPATGCYCVSMPTSNDGNGVSNVNIQGTDFASLGDVTYEDHTATVVDMNQGINNAVAVTFETGYTYNTNIWIDMNDDFNFDASELVYQGESASANPTTLDASFIIPATVPLGQHRMRIGTADSGQTTPNPCYNGSYGVTLDFTVNIVVPSCNAATAVGTLVPDCTNLQFSVDVDVTVVGDATELTDGTNTYPISGTGVITVGPFADGASVTISVTHTDSTCDFNVGNYTYTCPPANDNCMNAIPLTIEVDFATGMVVGSNLGATDSGVADPACSNYGGGDVWYSVVVPSDGIVTIDSNNIDFLDSGMAIYSGVCGSLVEIDCDDDGSANGAMSKIDLIGQTPGDTLLIRFFEYGNNSFGDFEIAAINPNIAATNNLSTVGFNYYPNPVTNNLTMTANENITSVSIFNMLGQEVKSEKLSTVEAHVDMANLANGTYFVKAQVGQTIGTFKIVKK